MGEPPDAAPLAVRPGGLLRAVVRNPRGAQELSVLYTLPQVSGAVLRWQEAVARRAGGAPDPVAVRRRAVRKGIALANRDGAVTGTSLYLCLLPAMASMYCHQIRLVLQIAATYGRDPASPARAAEYLVIRGRHPDTAAATAALLAAPRRARAAPPFRPADLVGLVREVPALLGLRLRSLDRTDARAALGAALQVATMVLPFIGIPVWAAASSRSTRHLARRAAAFYAAGPPDPGGDGPVLLAAPARSGHRWALVGVVLALALAVGVAVAAVPALAPHGQWWLVALAEAVVVGTFGRLLWITRPGPAPGEAHAAVGAQPPGTGPADGG